MIPDVNCVMANMPAAIKAYTTLNNDDTYTIILNSRLTYEQHLKSYAHELFHIKNGDYEKNNVDMIEFRAHSE